MGMAMFDRACPRTAVSRFAMRAFVVVIATAPVDVALRAVKVGHRQPKRHGEVNANREKCQEIAEHGFVIIGVAFLDLVGYSSDG